MKDVTELEVYQRALVLLKPIQRLADLLPVNEYKLKSQLLSAARSIPALTAEGFAKRRSQKEFKRFLEMALGSSDEVITHLRTIKVANFPKVKNITRDALIGHYKIVSKQLNNLIKTVKKNINEFDI